MIDTLDGRTSTKLKNGRSGDLDANIESDIKQHVLYTI